MKLARYLLPLAALAMTTSLGWAQTATPSTAPAAKPAATAPARPDAGKTTTMGKTTMSAADKSAKSKECSAQADQKGLHGKARKRFRDDCKRH